MADNYERLARENLVRLYHRLPDDLATRIGGDAADETYTFTAFGRACRISPEGISLDGAAAPGVLGILISLYALNASPEACVLEPLKAFKEFPGAAPYVGAFATHCENILVPAVPRIRRQLRTIVQRLDGERAPQAVGGDFAMVVRPMPKIRLCYIFYEADEDFPPSVTCLFSGNAHRFMPMDGLADVGEYTSKAILSLIA